MTAEETQKVTETEEADYVVWGVSKTDRWVSGVTVKAVTDKNFTIELANS